MAAVAAPPAAPTPGLPPLPVRPPSQTSSHRTRTHASGASNRREAAGSRPMTVPAGAARKAGSKPASAGSGDSRRGSDSGLPGSGPRRSVGSAQDSEAALEAYCRTAKPFSMRKRDDAWLLKRIGDKFYCYGNSSIRLRETFRKLDTDRSGALSYGELRQGLKQLNFGLTDEEFARLTQTIDKDCDGSVDYNEFMELFEAFQPLGAEAGTLVKDNMLTAAPWQEVRGEYKLFDKPVSPTSVLEKEEAEDGSYEQQAEDLRVANLIANRFHQSESKLRLIFRRFDDDKNGTISEDEFLRGMRKLNMGLSDKQLLRFMRNIDTDGSGTIEYEEFMDTFDRDTPLEPTVPRTKTPGLPGGSRGGTPAPSASGGPDDAEISRINAMPAVRELKEKMYRGASRARSVFKALDANGDGCLAPNEMKRAVQRLCPTMPPEQLDAVVAAADGNGDGYVNYREFISFIERDPELERSASRFHGTSPIPTQPRAPSTAAARPPTGASDRCASAPASEAAGRRSQSPWATSERSASGMSTASAASSFHGTERRRVGRFSSTPEPRDTRVLTAPEVGTPGYMSELDRLTRRSETPPASEEPRRDASRRSELLEGRRSRAAEHRASVEARQRRDEERRDARESANLESKSRAQRRYIERCRLYERAMQPSNGVDERKQHFDAAVGWQNFFCKGQF